MAPYQSGSSTGMRVHSFARATISCITYVIATHEMHGSRRLFSVELDHEPAGTLLLLGLHGLDLLPHVVRPRIETHRRVDHDRHELYDHHDHYDHH